MCRQRFNVHFYRSGFLFTFKHIRTVQIFSMLLNHLLSKCNSNQFCYLFYFKSCFGFLNSFSYQCAELTIQIFTERAIKLLQFSLQPKHLSGKKRIINKYKCNIYLNLCNQKVLFRDILCC